MKRFIDSCINEKNEPVLVYFDTEEKKQNSYVCKSLIDKAQWLRTKWHRIGYTQITFAEEIGIAEKTLYKKLKDFSFTLLELKKMIKIFDLNMYTVHYLFFVE